MLGVLVGFAIVAAVIATGWILGRTRLLGDGASMTLNRLAFFVLSPAILFTVLARADIHALLSTQLPVAAIASVTTIAAFLLVSLLAWRRRIPEAVVGALGAGYQNANNIGLPVSLYILGDAAASAPVILLQLVVLAPIALAILDMTTSGHASIGRVLLQPVRNPMVIGSVLGFICALTGWLPPEPVMDFFELLGGAAVPVLLINFGLSLAGSRILAPGPDRKDIVLASVLKLVAMPAIAWAVARFVFGLDGHALFVAVALAALPAANNVFNFAQRYDRGVTIGRDTVLITTVGSFPVLLVVAALLAA